MTTKMSRKKKWIYARDVTLPIRINAQRLATAVGMMSIKSGNELTRMLESHIEVMLSDMTQYEKNLRPLRKKGRAA